jgi:hypothetical protein
LHHPTTKIYHTYDALLEVNGIRPHQVLLERKIDDFCHKDAGDAPSLPLLPGSPTRTFTLTLTLTLPSDATL